MSQNKKQGERHKEQGNEQYKQLNYLKAEACYSSAIKLVPEEGSQQGNRSAARQMLKNWENCLNDCEMGIKRNPPMNVLIKLQRRASKCLLVQASFNKAKEYIKLAKGHNDNKNLEQEITGEQRQVQKAIDDYTQGQKALNEQNQKLAENFLGSVQEMCTENVDVAILQLKAIILSGNASKAIEPSLNCMNKWQFNNSINHQRGLCLQQTGSISQAKEVWNKVLQRDPDFKETLNSFKTADQQERYKNEGNTQFKNNELDKAIDCQNKAIDLDLLNKNMKATLLSNRAACQEKQKKQQQALVDCDEAIKLNPEFAKAFLRRGNVFYCLEEYDDALRDYNQANSIDPNLNLESKIKYTSTQIKKRPKKDYYQILGVDKKASSKDIRRSYLSKSMDCHPDRQVGKTDQEKRKAANEFKDLNQANTVLSNEDKRKKYDMGVDPDQDQGGFGGFSEGFSGFSGNGFGGMDPSSIFSMFAGDMFGGGGGGGHSFGNMGGGNSGNTRRFVFKFN